MNTQTDAGGAPLEHVVRRLVPEQTTAAPWRLLTRGEKIMRGDQGLNDDCETWRDVVSFVYGVPYSPGFFMPIRRAMPGCTAPDSCRGHDGSNGACKTPNGQR